jgi:hypothetical protein
MFPSFHARAGLTDQACVSFRRCPLECVMDRTPAPNDGKQDPCKLHPHPSGPESWGELNGEKRSQKNKTPSRTSSSLRRGAWVVGKIRSPGTAIPWLWERGVHGSSQRPHAPIHPWIAACSTETRLITQYCLEIPEQ